VSPLFASLTVLMTSAAIAQPVFVERMIYERPPPETREPAGEVAKLIGKLSDESSETRRTAAAALLKMGHVVEPQVRWARQHGENGANPLSWSMQHLREGNKWGQDPRHLRPWHAENELDVLISHLEEKRHSGTSIITLQFNATPLTNVLREFGRQANADVAVGGWYSLPKIDGARMTISVERVNFWDALQAIRDRSGLTATHVNAQNRLVLTVATSNKALQTPGAVVSGALRIAAVSKSNDASGTRLTLAAFVEPKFSGSRPHAMVTLADCADDHGQSLIANGKTQFPSLESPNTYAWTVPVDLRPLASGRKIKVLRGHFSVGIGPTDRYMTITNVLKSQGKSRELDGLKVTLKSVKAQGSKIDVELSAPAGSPSSRTFSASLELDVWLWDESRATIISEKLFHGTRREGDQDIASWTLTTPPNSLPPATLVWKTPAETRWHTVPFELHDIAVP
jgi:hypothetical protein